MVGIAQLVSAPDCGSGGRGFESLYPPWLFDPYADMRKDFLQSESLHNLHDFAAAVHDWLHKKFISAGMAELADAPDLGSGIFDVQVQVLLPALLSPEFSGLFL